MHSFPISFHVNDQKQIMLYDLKRNGHLTDVDKRNISNFSFIVDVNISSHPTNISVGDRNIFSSECFTLKYVNHSVENNHLSIIQENEYVRAISHYIEHPDSHVLESFTEVINISDKQIILESVSSFIYYALGRANSYRNTLLYVPHNSWFNEGAFKAYSLSSLGISHPQELKSFNKVKIVNTGTFSTKNYLPLGIIKDKNDVLMFEINSNNCWEYEIGDFASSYSLGLFGNTFKQDNSIKRLNPGETFASVKAYLTKGEKINDVIKNMTTLHRSLIKSQKECPVIFNEYMHASWVSPNEETARKLGPVAKELGADYYVIDCGWHDEQENPFNHIGKWEESKRNYPNGLKSTIDYLKGLGLKVGLWIEPETIGMSCPIIDELDKDMFFTHFGEPAIVANRYQLDLSNQKAFDFAFHNICKIIDKFRLNYVKFDYNNEFSVGTDSHNRLFGEGLFEHSEKVVELYQKIREKYPDVLLEGCASGGNRLDYKTLSLFDLCSISDQDDFRKYPPIVSNIFASVLPEQGGIWACPSIANKKLNDEDIVISMVNAMLGRIHLGGRLDLLNNKQKELVKESLDVYKSYSSLLPVSYPYLGKDFASVEDKIFTHALRFPQFDLISITTLKKNIAVKLSLDKPIKSIEVIYPSFSKTIIKYEGKNVLIAPEYFERARLLKIVYE